MNKIIATVLASGALLGAAAGVADAQTALQTQRRVIHHMPRTATSDGVVYEGRNAATTPQTPEESQAARNADLAIKRIEQFD